MNPWAERSHAEMAELVRELLLAGHLIDRSGMPAVIARLGREGMSEVAIGEWMAASPIYTKRMQVLLNYEGDNVETIFKGLQLDVGAPPEFMDFRLEIEDDHHGRFHLDHCGALMDVEPMGDEYVTTMCHDIEDPTFDATAIATNPKARVRPIHRPPRVPQDRSPHCEWSVIIDADNEELPIPPGAIALSRCNAAQLPITRRDTSLIDDDGWTDYSGPMDPDLVMERFSTRTLAAIADEVALQCHLLARAYLVEVADRVAPGEVIPIGIAQASGIAGLTTKRLAATLDASADLEGLEMVLNVHPMLLPRTYVDVDIERESDGLRVSLNQCPALDEHDGLSWTALMAGPGGDEILNTAVVCLLPTAEVTRVDISGNDDPTPTWIVTDDPERPPVRQPNTVTLTEFSTGALFTFERRT